MPWAFSAGTRFRGGIGRLLPRATRGALSRRGRIRDDLLAHGYPETSTETHGLGSWCPMLDSTPATPGRLRRESASSTVLGSKLVASWDSTQPIPLAELLADTNDTATLADLACLEIECRLRAARPARAMDYLRQYPQLAEGEWPRYLLEAELLARKKFGPPARLEEFAEWLSAHGDHVLLRELGDKSAIRMEGGRPANAVSTSGRDDGTLPPSDTPQDAGEPNPDKWQLPKALGPYLLVKAIGKGGMGCVYLADDTALRRNVAVKTLRPDAAHLESYRERFFREARAVAAIEHDHIVPIYYVGEADGVPFLSMPLLKGQSLDDRLRAGPLTLVEAVRIARETASGLAAAHARGIVHRDVKPGNIWLEATPSGSRAKLLDFGLARPADDLELSGVGAVLGTPNYMSHEQATGEVADARSDLFSLGVVLYRMTTGRLPYPGDNLRAITHSLGHHTPTRPNLLNPHIPDALSEVIMRLLSIDRDARPASADETLKLLPQLQTRTHNANGDPLREAETVLLAPERTSTAVSGGSRRRRRAWPVALAVVLLATALFGGYKLFFETKEGTLVVEVEGEADVRFKNGELHLYDEDGKLAYKLKPSQREVNLRTGKYSVRVVGADGIELDTLEFKLERKGVIIRVAASRTVAAVGRDVDRVAAQHVLARGGSVQIDGGPKDAKELPTRAFTLTGVNLPGPGTTNADLERLAGCGGLTSLNINQSGVTDDGLRVVGQFEKLTDFFAQGVGLTDAGLTHLKGCTRLVNMNLNGTKITDAGLDSLRGTTTLQILALDGTRSTGVGLAGLKNNAGLWFVSLKGTDIEDNQTGVFTLFPNLAQLDLTATKLTDKGAAALMKLNTLKNLFLDDTRVSSAGLAQVGGLKLLQNLRVNRTAVTDEVLNQLDGLGKLEGLELSGTAVTDTGLTRLTKFTTLRQLDVRGTKATAEWLRAFQKAVPGCRVNHDIK